MNHLVRRSVSIAAATTSASKRGISTALLTSDPCRLSSAIPSEPFSTAGHIQAFLSSKAFPESTYHGGIWQRSLHFASRPLGIRATGAASAQAAVAELSDEENLGTDEERDEGLDIAKLGIAEEIVSRLARKGITKLFPIQRAVLEPAMKGHDIIGRAKTGTGKTLAFGIPIMNKIIRFNAKNGKQTNPLALVLAPTRELARQVEKEFCESSNLETLCVYGGVPIQRQISALHHGVDAVIGTPGRIIDLLKRGALNLSEVQFVVLDEADQMLAVGFDEDVEKILDKLSPKRQSMMFSATMPPWIRKLTQKYLKNPVTVDLVGENDQKLAEGITLYSIATDKYSKPSVLNALIKEHGKGGKCIVFTQTKRDADQLARVMGQSFGCQPLHGDIPQGDRERTLSGFRAGQFNVLIATDVAARGLDIPNVELVIHYELPNNSELFVHRSGRTGRAGKKGSAIVIYTQDKKHTLRGVEQDVGCKFKELPAIEVEGGDMFSGMGGRFDSGGGRRRTGDSSFGRGGNGSFGGSSYGRHDNFGDRGSGHSGRGGSSSSTSSSRWSNFSSSGKGTPGSFGSSSQGNSFGGSGSKPSWWQ